MRAGVGIPLRDLAKRARVSPTTLSLYERGRRDLAPATYARLVSVYADILHERAAS